MSKRRREGYEYIWCPKVDISNVIFLIKENPDVILTLVKNPEEIVKANPQIKDVSAIKNRKFIVLDSNQVLRGSPRIVDHIAEVYEKTGKN